MRKLLLVFSALCISFAPAVPVGADPGAGTFADQWAHASWIELHGKTGSYIGANAIRLVDEEAGPITLGMVARGKCEVERGGGWMSISCFGRGYVKEIPFTDFQLDPLFSSAELNVRAGGFDNHVSWTGRSSWPQISQGVDTNGEAAVAQAFMYRGAKTHGTVLGKKGRTRSWLDWGFMVGGVAAGVWTDGNRSIDLDIASDGTFTIEEHFRTRL